jgi:5-methylcytosine-specific restriction protein A
MPVIIPIAHYLSRPPRSLRKAHRLMPTRAPRLNGCGCVTAYGVLCEHARQRKIETDRRRPTARQRGYTVEWQRESRLFLNKPENRFCACGCGRYADLVDHRTPHRGDRALFWDRSNWQPMATHCHSSSKQSLERRNTPGVDQTLALGAGTAHGQHREINPNSAPGNSRLRIA